MNRGSSLMFVIFGLAIAYFFLYLISGLCEEFSFLSFVPFLEDCRAICRPARGRGTDIADVEDGYCPSSMPLGCTNEV